MTMVFLDAPLGRSRGLGVTVLDMARGAPAKHVGRLFERRNGGWAFVAFRKGETVRGVRDGTLFATRRAFVAELRSAS